jgi:hypothetical protein
MSVESHVDAARIVIRRLHPTDVAARRDAVEVLCELGPAAAVVLGHPDAAVVGACVEATLLER